MRGSPLSSYGQTTAQVIRELKGLKLRLARQIHVDRMILFGSRVRGDWLFAEREDAIRLISVRKATRGERREYEEGKG